MFKFRQNSSVLDLRSLHLIPSITSYMEWSYRLCVNFKKSCRLGKCNFMVFSGH